jgi:hypothetical protein
VEFSATSTRLPCAPEAGPAVDSRPLALLRSGHAQVAELVDALVSGTSGASREGSSPFLGTIGLISR